MSQRFSVPLTKRYVYPSTGYEVTLPVEDQFDRITDERNRVRRVKPKGWLDPTAYHRTTEWFPESVEVNGYARRQNPYIAETYMVGRSTLQGSLYSRVPPAPDILEQRLLTKARLDLKGQNVNFSQAMAERKLTAGLVVDSLGRLTRGARAIRHGNLRKAAEEFGVPYASKKHPSKRRKPSGSEFFDNFLELQYGWKPLYQDIHGAVTQLSEAEQKRNGEVRAHVKVGGREFNRDKRELAETADGGYWWFNVFSEVEHRAQIRLDFAHTSPSLSTAQQLGLTNPAQLAWELVPFSFVVDWFIPVGDFFAQLDATLGWSYRGGTYSEKSVRTQSVEFSRMEGYNPGFKGYCTTSGVKSRQMSFARTVYGTEPMAVIPAPKRWDQAFSAVHIANAIALFGSIVLGGGKVR